MENKVGQLPPLQLATLLIEILRPELSVQLLSVTPTAHWLEYADWWNPVLREPLRIENGMALVAGVTGTGVEWNENAVAKFCI